MKRILSLLLTVAMTALSLSVAATAEADAADVSVEFYIRETHAEGTALTVEVRAAVGDILLNSFGMSVDYDSEVLSLASCSFTEPGSVTGTVGGIAIGSQSVDIKPYRIMWVGGTVNLGKGDHLVATLTFDILTGTVPEDVRITIGADSENPPGDMNGKPVSGAVTDGEITVSSRSVAWKTPVLRTEYTKGEALDLTDAALIVKWHGTQGKSETVPLTEDMISGYDPDTYGEQTVTVTYEDFSDTFTVNVSAIPGDADRSGAVNLIDAALLMKYIAKWDVTPDTVAADVDDKNGVNLNDVSLIMRHVAGWDVVLK